uniref:Uncharacterized protein n=1 Tax=Rhizophora mucronata TaxID=61149 RepID=A0A2P2J4Q6_RHIMU
MADLKPCNLKEQQIEWRKQLRTTSRWKNGQKRTLQAITVLSFFANNIKHGINQLCALSVMPFSPVVSRTGLSENKIVRPKNLAIGACPDSIHSARLKVHEDSPWYIPATVCLIVINVDSLKLDIGITLVTSGGLDVVLCADNLPELGPNLVATLASLDMKNFTHLLIKR